MLRRPVARDKGISPQLCRKLHILSRHPGADAAPVRLGDAPGDGQPDAKPSGGGDTSSSMRDRVTNALTSAVSFSVCACALSIHFCFPVSISSRRRLVEM